jgi:alcohol dehydrogenase class IV
MTPGPVPSTPANNDVVTLHQPRTLVFGAGSAARCATDLIERGVRRVFVVTSPSTQKLGEPTYATLRQGGGEVFTWSEVRGEPTVEVFRSALSAARDARPDAIIGLGGGSPMDVAKLIAALLESRQDVVDVFGIGKLVGARMTHLVCLPTTAGTGSEVSPNAVLLDEGDWHLFRDKDPADVDRAHAEKVPVPLARPAKKAAISPQLVPDAAYVDPLLTLSVSPAVTAATGMDALTHCIEAYANRFAHPIVDPIALAGIGLIARNLARAVADGNDVAARTAVAQGSLFGGLCLGPVNTAAVHALSYPLGSEYHVAHGISNAVLLPHVLEFNLPAAPKRYADIARAMGAEPAHDDIGTAYVGLQIIRDLMRDCGIPMHIGKPFGVPPDAIEQMAESAMNVQRLLVRNVREVTLHDAIEIYRRAF